MSGVEALPLASEQVNETVRYEPHENPPLPLTLGAGVQAALSIIAGIVLTPVIIVNVAQAGADYLAWAVFAAMMVSGITTILQAVRVWRIGSGHVLMMGTSGAFIAVCIAAMVEGGPATMASLVVVSSLFQFMLASRLSWFRRLLTPVVSGTVIMLIAATVLPILYDMLSTVPDDVPASAGAIAAAVTAVVVVGLAMRGPKVLRIWAPIIGIAVGCVVSAPFGLYDAQPVLDAPWFGVPFASWPGLDVTPGPEFWALLPAFVVVTMVGAIETLGDSVAIQRVSRRRPHATDFRVVQGALNADGMGNLLSGLAGTTPNTTYSSSISLAELTGIGARRVGVAVGIIFILLAFFPKATALIIAIPTPVAGAYVIFLIAVLFVQGMRIALSEGLNTRKAAIIGVAFWLGVGFQGQLIFPDLIGDGFMAVLLGNGMTAGAIVAVGLSAFGDLTGSRRRSLRMALDDEALPKVLDFARGFSSRHGWDAASADRLAAACEETLAVLSQYGAEDGGAAKSLRVSARLEGGSAEIEFASAMDGENLEDRLSYLSELPQAPDESEISYRLLRHYAHSISHQKYYGIDVISLRVDGPI